MKFDELWSWFHCCDCYLYRNLPCSSLWEKNEITSGFPSYITAVLFVASIIFHRFRSTRPVDWLRFDRDLIIGPLSWPYRHSVANRRKYHQMPARTCLMDLLRKIGHADQLAQCGFDNRSGLIRCRWLIHEVGSIRSVGSAQNHALCVVRNCARVSLQLQRFKCRFAFRSYLRFGFLIHLKCSTDTAIGTFPNIVTVMNLPNSTISYQEWMTCKILIVNETQWFHNEKKLTHAMRVVCLTLVLCNGNWREWYPLPKPKYFACSFKLLVSLCLHWVSPVIKWENKMLMKNGAHDGEIS